MNSYLVINLGLRSIRAIVFDDTGTILEKNWYPITTTIAGDMVEQNPKEWWLLCSQMLHELCDTKKEYVKNLSALTITSSSSCLVVTDTEGNPLMNALMVSDKRATKETEPCKKLLTNPNHKATASFMIPKIMWLQKHRQKMMKNAAYFMNAGDFLLYKLTGTLTTDTLNAEKFYYDIDKKSYTNELLQLLNLSKKQFPEVVLPGTIVGSCSPEIIKEFGFNQKTKVIVSSYDAICAFLGSGVTMEGDASNVCGTVTSLRVMTNQKTIKNNAILLQKMDAFNIAGGSNNIDGGLLEWAKNMFYGDSYPEKYVYKIMEDEAESSPVGSNGLLFLPYLVGERFPFEDTAMRGIFFGLERFHKRNDIVRSIFEAGSLMVYDMISEIESNGIPINVIKMSGGLSSNRIACRIRADFTGKTIQVIDELETTSLGALFLMMKALDASTTLKRFSQFVKIKETYRPDKKNHAMYRQLFTLFKKVYEQNRDLMIERKKIMKKISDKNVFILENL